MAILDSTVDRGDSVIHHEVLEVDNEGNTPDKEDFVCPDEHSIELIMKHKEHFQVDTHEKCFSNDVTPLLSRI